MYWWDIASFAVFWVLLERPSSNFAFVIAVGYCTVESAHKIDKNII
jgi:hypothetical protein